MKITKASQCTSGTSGTKVTCSIMGDFIKDAVIHIDSDGCVYLCQNKHEGLKCENRHGYKFSWVTSCNDLRHWGIETVEPITKEVKEEPKKSYVWVIWSRYNKPQCYSTRQKARTYSILNGGTVDKIEIL